jgi:hypothetical protein
VDTFAQRPRSYAILDVLVFGIHLSVEPSEYSSEVRGELEAYLRRAREHTSARPRPASGELQMVHGAQVNYERLLVAIAASPVGHKVAAEYVEALRPCYEWEGYADCPERDARFADKYLAGNPGNPFTEYLPLLSAHRWLCAAEGYDYVKVSQEAARSRRNYEQRLAVALKSQGLLIRTAAAELSKRGKCHPGPRDP